MVWRNILSFLFFLILSAVMTYPLVLNFSIAVNDLGDPLFNTWTLAWNHHQLLTDPMHYFDANIFYPFKMTFAYSEHLIALALFSLPLYLLGAGPITVYNFVLFSSFVLCGWGMFLLVRELTQKNVAGLLAGMAFAFSAYRFSQLPHLQVLSFQWMPFVLLYLHRAFEKKPSWKHFLLFGFFFLLQLLSCNYLALMISLVVGFWLLFMLPQKWKQIRWSGLMKLLTVFAISGVLFLPFAIPYVKVKKDHGFSRSFQDLKPYSAKFKNFFGVTGKHRLYPKVMKDLSNVERSLFIGFTILILALLGLLFVRDERLKRLRWIYLFIFVLGLLLSMGVNSKLFGISLNGEPYRIFYKWIPGFDGMRVVSRFVILMSLALSVLGGIGISVLLDRLKKRFLIFGVTLLLGIGILADGWCVPVRYRAFVFQPPPVHLWLKDQEDVQAVVHLPIFKGAGAYREMNYMYWGMWNWKKMVNGYSGFFPPGYEERVQILNAFPDAQSLAELRKLGVNYVVFHTHKYPGQHWQEKEKQLKSHAIELELIKEFESARVYRLK